MTFTIKLYDEHPYDTTFVAQVVSTQTGERPGAVNVILDQTLFFPEEGGQTPDVGVLAGFPVIDVQISKENVITHTLDIAGAVHSDVTDTAGEPELPASLAVGTQVSGTIDWNHRYSNMQNHSGEHILSGLLHTIYGYENVGFRLSDNTVTLDTSGQLTEEQILDLERRANEVVWSNVPITCEYPAPEVLEALEYRSKKVIDGAVRIVTIEGIDACACCAPHVRRTGEIGLIKILDVLHNKKDMRLTIVCGSRALEEMQNYQNELTRVSHLTSAPRIGAAAGTQRLLDEISSLKENVKNAQIRYIDTRLAAIAEDEQRAAGCENPDLSERTVWIFEGPLDNLAQRSFMNQLCEMGYRFAGVFAGSDEDGWKYLIGSRGDDARLPNNILKEQFKARGGGKPEMVQGSLLATQEQILAALDSFGE